MSVKAKMHGPDWTAGEQVEFLLSNSLFEEFVSPSY